MIWMLLLIRHIKIVIIVIFIDRVMLLVGVILSFRQINVLGSDESFFAKLTAISSDIALVVGNFFTKCLNKIVIDLGFVILIIVILKFNLNSR